MSFSKAKQILEGKARALISKAQQKRREADKLELEAEQLKEDAKKL